MLDRPAPSFRLLDADLLPASTASCPNLPSSEALPDTSEWREVLDQLGSLVYPSIRELRDMTNLQRQKRFNKNNKLVSFKVGSFVMAQDPLRSSKLAPRFEGPYKVVRRNKGGAYILMDHVHDHTLLHRNYAPNQLISVHTPVVSTSDTSDVFVVERIINHRRVRNRFEYLVKWKGFPEDQNSWEPETNILDPVSITIFWKHPAP